VVVALVLVNVFRAHPGPGWHGSSLGVSVALGGLVAGGLGVLGTLAGRRAVGSVQACAFVVLLVSSAALVWLQPDGLGLLAVLAVLGTAVSRLPRRMAAILLGTAVVFLVVARVADDHAQLSSIIVNVLAVVGFCSMAMGTRRLREGNEQAERLLIELERTRDAELRAAALAERQRLAREMHDILAHSLSGLALQLEGARLLAAQDPSDPRLGETVERAHHLAKTGLEEARRAIGMLRDDELPGPHRLAALAAGFERDSGVRCQFGVSGDPRELGSEARLALYRVAQEALTNIRKHADPGRVEVHLGYERRGTRLTIEDFSVNGRVTPRCSGDGYGLTGMRERAELLGGTLTAAATAGGFLVELRVPA